MSVASLLAGCFLGALPQAAPVQQSPQDPPPQETPEDNPQEVPEELPVRVDPQGQEGSQDGAAAEPEVQAEPAEARRVELDERRYYSAAQLGTALGALADAYPEFVRLESMGTSRGGRELWVVTLSSRDDGDPGDKAGVLVVGGVGSEDPHGAEMVLFTLYDLLLEQGRDPAVARALERSTLYLVPCLDPDRRAALLNSAGDDAQPRVVDLNANFPRAWTPWDQGRSGPYPLSEPESRALVDFLASHPNVAALQTFAGQGLARADSERAELPESEREIYATVLQSAETQFEDPAQVASFSQLGAAAGSLLEHAALELGVFGFCCDVTGSAGMGLPQVDELAPLSRRVRSLTLLLSDVLGQLELEEPQALELQEGLWQVDVTLVNVGLLPTLTRAAERHRVAPKTRLSVTGARLLAVAVSRSPQGPFEPLRGPLDPGILPAIEGGERVSLRLVLEGQREDALELQASSSRAGLARVTIPLE